MNSINDCGGESIYIPESHCDDCSALENRVRRLELLLENIDKIPFEKKDQSTTVSGYFLGEVTTNG